jgi:hypothetical protein
MSNQLEERLEQLETAAGIEAHGIERVLPDQRSHIRVFDNFTLWASANLVLSTLALGSLSTLIFQHSGRFASRLFFDPGSQARTPANDNLPIFVWLGGCQDYGAV